MTQANRIGFLLGLALYSSPSLRTGCTAMWLREIRRFGYNCQSSPRTIVMSIAMGALSCSVMMPSTQAATSPSVAPTGKLRETSRGPALSAAARSGSPHLALSRRDNLRLKQRLERAEAIIEIQKKVAVLLGLPASSDDES